MKFLEDLIERVGVHFKEGGKFSKWYQAYRAFEVFLFVPPDVTEDGSHIRDANDIKRTMTAVIKALIPCVLFGIWNIGHQHYVAIGQYTGITDGFLPKFLYGLGKFLPILIISYAVGLTIEFIFAVVRNHPVSEGYLVSGLLISLIVPPTLPLWTLIPAIVIGVIFGKEVFGGTGYNIVNPALFVRAILFFGYPQFMTGSIWIAGEGISGATPLGSLKTGSITLDSISPWDAFWGFIPGSIGETSTFLCLLGAIYLMYLGVASPRIIFSAVVGAAIMGIIMNWVGGSPIAKMPFWYHYIIGGFAFGVTFMATDPVSSPKTPLGKIIYGFMIGVLIVFLRVVNPAYPEVTMLVILFMNSMAPLIDVSILAYNRRKRVQRWKGAVKPEPLLIKKPENVHK